VVFVHPDDISHLGFADGDLVDLVSEWTDGSERTAPDFRIVAYDQPRGCAAAYYPETNPLVPLDHVAEGSNTPSSKSVIVRLQRRAGRSPGVTEPSDAGAVAGGHDDGTKRKVEPEHHG
jgi:formate dehydrogenase major subunit